MEGAEGKGGKIIGYSWWIREGNDAGAKSLMSRDTMWARESAVKLPRFGASADEVKGWREV